MKRSRRIKVIVEIKARHEKDALEILGASQRKLKGMQAQLDNLRNYRLDYQNQFDRMGSSGVNVAQLMEFRSFIDKLDKAIAGQEQSLQGMQDDIMEKKKVWEKRHNQTASIQKVCDAALAAEIKHENKLEQLEQDEWASRFVQSRSSHTKDVY